MLPAEVAPLSDGELLRNPRARADQSPLRQVGHSHLLQYRPWTFADRDGSYSDVSPAKK